VKRGLYEPDHEAFRDTVQEFVAREVTPNVERWEEQTLIDREVWLAAGKQGIIGLPAPQEYGGAGILTDYRYRNVVQEEFANAFATSLSSSFGLQDDITIPYIVHLGTEEQKRRWLPAMVSGEKICAIAMTEPGTGSDLQGIRTTGVKVDGGWVVNGAKTFITSGILSDLVIVVVRTNPDGGSSGFSLLVSSGAWTDSPGATG
jgi:alkylation response protein AidB-like acyl-CoA dehydrogenase